MSAGTLTDFLLARIAEDEAVARQAIGRTHINEYGEVLNLEMWSEQDWIEIDVRQLMHVQAWHPVRVLAECEAKRRIVRWYQTLEGMVDNERLEIRHNELLHVLTALAHPHADHPDFRPEWRL